MFFSYHPARDTKEIDYLVFNEVLDNVARLDLVLTEPGGSLVLAGRSGVGRRTAAMLVAHMHQVNIITPKVSRGYGTKQFKADLKVVSWCCLIYSFFFSESSLIFKLFVVQPQRKNICFKNCSK